MYILMDECLPYVKRSIAMQMIPKHKLSPQMTLFGFEMACFLCSKTFAFKFLLCQDQLRKKLMKEVRNTSRVPLLSCISSQSQSYLPTMAFIPTSLCCSFHSKSSHPTSHGHMVLLRESEGHASPSSTLNPTQMTNVKVVLSSGRYILKQMENFNVTL